MAASENAVQPFDGVTSQAEELKAAPEASSGNTNVRTVFPSPLFATAEVITKRLSGPAVKIPPPVLQGDGHINKEYFGVLAAEKGPYITNVPPHFPEDHATDRIERCCKTQEIAQAVHGVASLDLKTMQAYVAKTGKVVACLPTIGYMNMPGPPSDCGGTMVCTGAVILTEDRIFLFGSNSNKEASASDSITGTTFCTYLCCCFPCCYGFCGCVPMCKVTTFAYRQVALRENEDFQDSVKLSNAKVSIKNTSMTALTREYTAGKIPGDSCCKPCCDICKICCSCCSGICKPCYYHGSHTFQYSDDGTKTKNVTIDSLTEKTVGHDDMAWGLMDEMALASLLTDPKTKNLFAENPDSTECRALLLKSFSSKFSPEQCQKKVLNLKQGLKTKDLCTSKSVMTVNITHWDTASQKIRNTVCVCDPSQVKAEDMMQFQVNASADKNSMNDCLLSVKGSDIALPAGSRRFGFGGRGGWAGGIALDGHSARRIIAMSIIFLIMILTTIIIIVAVNGVGGSGGGGGGADNTGTATHVVKMAVSLPMTVAEFDDGKQTKFTESIAKVAGAKPADVTIDKIEAIPTSRRRLLAPSIRVDTSVKAKDSAAADAMGAKLNSDNINTELSKAGLPAAEILAKPTGHPGCALNGIDCSDCKPTSQAATSVATATRTSLEPASCVVPDDCVYLCSAKYILTTPDDNAVVLEPGPVRGCTCVNGISPNGQTKTEDTITFGNPDSGDTLTGVVTSQVDVCTFNIVIGVGDLSCTATYSISGMPEAGCDGPAKPTTASASATVTPTSTSSSLVCSSFTALVAAVITLVLL